MTAEEILALPIYTPAERVIRCRCGITHHIPMMERASAMYFKPDDVFLAVDAEGVAWRPYETERGMFRKRAN